MSMKRIFIKTIKITLILLIIFTFSQIIISDIVSAQDFNTYVSISPLPGTENVNLEDPGSYFSNLFTIFIVIASALAVIRLMLCGISYMTSESISTKTDAKGCIWAVFSGLFLILLSVIILGQINKDFLKLDFESITQKVSESTKSVKSPAGSGGFGSGGGTSPKKIPTIISFSSDKTTVGMAGSVTSETFTLSWKTENTGSCSGKHGGTFGANDESFDTGFAPSGSSEESISPVIFIFAATKEYVYTLTCSVGASEVKQKLTITVINS